MPTVDILPLRLRQSMRLLGHGINVARRRRRLTAASMAERLGVGRQTYQRIERGDPTVAMGTYVMAFFVLGLDWSALEKIAEPMADDLGTSLAIEQLPKRVRSKRNPTPK